MTDPEESAAHPEQELRIEYYNCSECRLQEMPEEEARIHEEASGHNVVPVYQ